MESSDPDRVTVDDAGKVRGMAAGECTVTVNVAGMKLPCRVVVN